MYFGRGTHVPRSGYDDNEAFLRRLSGEKEKTKHVKRKKQTACVVFKDNRDNRYYRDDFTNYGNFNP